MSRITIQAGSVTLEAELNDSATAKAIGKALPLEGSANVWGDEIYFDIPVHVDEAPDAREEMAVGELAFWPSGDAFCIFFGPTPVSTGSAPRAYSPVNPFGMIDGDATAFKAVKNGAKVRVTAC